MGDGLSGEARKQHRNLLVTASIAFLFFVLDPTHISPLGVDVESTKRNWIFAILLIALVYFVIAYGAAVSGSYFDWKHWLEDHEKELEDVRAGATPDQASLEDLEHHLQAGEPQEEIDRRRGELEKRAAGEAQRAARLAPALHSVRIRGWFDFYVPFVYAFAAISLLVYELGKQVR